MKKSTLHTIFKRLLIFILVFAFWPACNEYMGVVDCDECYSIEPDSADLIIYLTINKDHPEVPLVIYRGNIEDDTDWVDTAVTSPYYLYSKIDQFYSVKAEYHVGDRTINVVEGGKVQAKHVSESCDWECWVITGGELNAELKFDGD
jgi:hypothetical protein